LLRYTIYDDLLTLSPGGWQGGFVPAEDECFAPNLKLFTERVPIAIYRRRGVDAATTTHASPAPAVHVRLVSSPNATMVN
jgi:hypothetical protein